MTTWAETADPSRSDCHAWGSSPRLRNLSHCGRHRHGGPGFKRVVIRPYLGKLTRVSGTIPHPQGEIAVSLNLRPGGKLEADVSLPPAVSGEFIWRGNKRALAPGKSKLVL
ncbi:MAG: alpha-L-rhamnosidase C-terminal domain-containing protein [Pyrinomonadaceae bacterium]